MSCFVYYTFVHWRELEPFLSMEIKSTGESWEELCYRIEEKHGLHKHGQKRHARPNSFMVGWKIPTLLSSWCKFEMSRTEAPLGRSFHCHPGDLLMVARRPLREDQRPHVPLSVLIRERKVQSILESTANRACSSSPPHLPQLPLAVPPPPPVATANAVGELSEQERLAAFVEQSAREALIAQTLAKSHHQVGNRRQHQHRVPGTVSQRAPPASYVCHRCSKTGHWKHQCPTLDDPTFQPLKRFKAPTGIPRRLLRKAETEEEKAHALRTSTGELVVPQISTFSTLLTKRRMETLTDEANDDDESQSDDGVVKSNLTD